MRAQVSNDSSSRVGWFGAGRGLSTGGCGLRALMTADAVLDQLATLIWLIIKVSKRLSSIYLYIHRQMLLSALNRNLFPVYSGECRDSQLLQVLKMITAECSAIFFDVGT